MTSSNSPLNLWETFLLESGATRDAGGKLCFHPGRCADDYVVQQSADDSWICSLQDWQVLSISGPDSKTFLQGQLSCDLDELSATHGLAGSLSTPKGRAVSNFYLLQRSETELVFLVPTGSASATLQTLSKYIVFSKAELSDAADQWQVFGLSGPAAARAMEGVTSPAGASRLDVTAGDIFTLCVNPSRYLLACPADIAQETWAALSKNAQAANADLWALLDIRDGLGFISEATVETFIPQMLNLQSTDGISFSKGCYTGQEIIARAHYRGTLKRAMYRVECQANTPLEPGSTVLNAADPDKTIGEVVSCCQRDVNTVEMLIVVARDDDGPRSALIAVDNEYLALTFLDLPYAIDTVAAD